MSKQFDIQQTITNQIIDLLESVNIEDYHPPFGGLSSLGLPKNPITKHVYNGINILNLWLYQQAKNYSSNEWATFKQWKEVDASVKKGEKSSKIIFYKTLTKSEETENAELEEIKIPMLKVYNVFNANQVEGYKSDIENDAPIQSKVKNIENIDLFCKETKAIIKHSGHQAYYSTRQDYINMPERPLFQNTPQANATENYYATLLHELTHWTGAKHRLNRFDLKDISNNTGKENYAFEELVAELGSAFLCAQHGITQIHPEHHTIYIKSWLKSLKNNKAYIFKASAKASKAVDFLYQNKPSM
ncbi:zincin-like metallopeptidase domain-containing protein [Seonamhaeicola sp. MEBiC1930]|uniref:ArdC family protein n=1 Tax=Seonamhaeicola sp. MEBiC01930 TaxID=2976768 RepID=UPI0032477556